MMTPTEMGVAIAEKCNWQKRFSIDENDKTIHWCLYDVKGNCIASGLPNYLECLNACHEMEKVLIKLGNYNTLYATELVKIQQRDWLQNKANRYIWNATAPQRCEAFCRMFWPERFKV